MINAPKNTLRMRQNAEHQLQLAALKNAVAKLRNCTVNHPDRFFIKNRLPCWLTRQAS